MRNKTPNGKQNPLNSASPTNSFETNIKNFIDHNNNYFYSNFYDINETCSSSKIYSNKQKALNIIDHKNSILQTIKVIKKCKNPEALKRLNKNKNESNLKFVYFNKLQKSKISKSVKANSCDSKFKLTKHIKNLIHNVKNNYSINNYNISRKNNIINNKIKDINFNISDGKKESNKENHSCSPIKTIKITNSNNSNIKRNLELYHKKKVLNNSSKEKKTIKKDNFKVTKINKKNNNKIIIIKNIQKLQKKDKISILEFNELISEKKTCDSKKSGINSVKINNYNVNKPKEINLKYKLFKDYICDDIDDEIVNTSQISKIFIGEIEGYNDILEDDEKKNKRENSNLSKNTIHQRSKSLNSSKNLIEDLNELSGFLDINNINYRSKEISFIDDQFETTEKKCASFDDSPILIDNDKRKKNFVYSNKKAKRKNYFNNKNNKEMRSKLFCKLKNDTLENNNEKCFIY